jgi:hypothetical protein
MTRILQQPGEAAIHQLIAERAYQIWESQGRPRVYEVVNWRQAEQEVIAMLAETAPARSGRHTRLSDGLILNTRLNRPRAVPAKRGVLTSRHHPERNVARDALTSPLGMNRRRGPSDDNFGNQSITITPGRKHPNGRDRTTKQRLVEKIPMHCPSKFNHYSFVDARDNSFHSPPCFCQFIRMCRLVELFLPSGTLSLSPSQ